MSGRVTFHVVKHYRGLDWPISFEFEIISHLDIQQKIDWLEARDYSPAFYAMPREKAPPEKLDKPPVNRPGYSEPMTQAQAVGPQAEFLPSSQICPVHGSKMAESKFQEDAWTNTHYCPARKPDGHYCKVRCGLDKNGHLAWKNLPT